MSTSTLVLTATLLAGLLPPTPTPGVNPIAVGKPAPTVGLTSLDGKPLNLPKGRPALIDVFATSCLRCRAEISIIVAAYARERRRVAFIGIDEREPRASVAAFVHRMRVRYAIGIDAGGLAQTYGAGAVPHSIFIDARGIVRAMWNGPLSREQLEANLSTIGGG